MTSPENPYQSPVPGSTPPSPPKHAPPASSLKKDKPSEPSSDASWSASVASKSAQPSPRKDAQPSNTHTLVDAAKDTVQAAAEGAAEIVHTARDIVVDTARPGVDYIEHTARQLGESAGDLVDTVATQAVRAARSTKGFARSNALPLLMVGTGLTWLALRQLGQSPRPTRDRPRQQRILREPRSEPRVSTATREGPPLSASTPAGTKLIGVRVHDTGYIE